METISIADFERLVSERLSNPKAYANRSLLLWNGRYTQDSIEYEVMEQCCMDYNGIHPDNQIWFRYSDFCFQDEDYSKGLAFCEYEEMYGYKPCRILFNTGCFMTNETDNWIKFVNSHTNNNTYSGANPPSFIAAKCRVRN